jgi:phosphopantetheinyl transferase (holo-ACP synthase)
VIFGTGIDMALESFVQAEFSKCFLSLSHDANCAVAMLVLEK